MTKEKIHQNQLQLKPPILAIEQCSIEQLRYISLKDLSEIMDMRRESFYGDPEDKRYLYGGVYTLLDEEKINKSHMDDPHSRFFLVRAPDGELTGYSRFSIIDPGNAKYDNRVNDHLGLQTAQPFLNVIIIMTRLEYRGVEVAVDGEIQKTSEHIFRAMQKYAREYGCSAMVADIATAPTPNNASIGFHTHRGFEKIGEAERVPKKNSQDDEVDVVFTRYARKI